MTRGEKARPSVATKAGLETCSGRNFTCQVKERVNMFLDNVSLVSDSWKRVWASCSCGRAVAQTGAYERCRLRSSPRFLRTASRRMSAAGRTNPSQQAMNRMDCGQASMRRLPIRFLRSLRRTALLLGRGPWLISSGRKRIRGRTQTAVFEMWTLRRQAIRCHVCLPSPSPEPSVSQ